MVKPCINCWAHRRTEWCVLDRSGLTLHDRKRQVNEYKPGDLIFEQGQDSDGLFCVESGNILLNHLDAFKNETAFRAVFQGEVFGIRSYFSEQPHNTTAKALSACRVCFIPKTSLEALFDKHPELAREFLRSLGRDRGPWEALLLRSPLQPVHIRLIHFLLILRESCAKKVSPYGLVFDLPLQRKEIAAMLATRKETLSRAIKELERQGLANFKGRRVMVPDLRKLLEITQISDGQLGLT